MWGRRERQGLEKMQIEGGRGSAKIEKKQREGGRGRAKIEVEATRAKIVEAEQNDINDEEYVEERNKQRSERDTHTAINRNDEASTYI
jgi:hypothetical protein